MKYKKCIILYIANYCEKINSLFGIEQLLKMNVEIEYWNVSKLTANQHLLPYEYRGLKEIEVHTYAELKSLINQNRRALFMPYINYGFFSLRVYRLLSKYNCSILYATSGVLPQIESVFFTKLYNLSFKKIGLFGINRLLRLLLKTPLFTPADFVMLSCNRATCDYKVSAKTVFLPFRSNDYEAFCISEKKGEEIDFGVYIAFIDQYLPYHNDTVLLGGKLISPDIYYSLLNNFFLKVEQKYKCNVVICAHPSALLYKEYNPFDGRKIVFHKTSQCVRNSIGVILHNSTAISHAVLANKQILIYSTNDLIKFDMLSHKYAEYFSKLLNLPFVNLDSYDSFDFKEVDKDKYKQYIFDYLVFQNVMETPNYKLIYSILNDTYLNFKL